MAATATWSKKASRRPLSYATLSEGTDPKSVPDEFSSAMISVDRRFLFLLALLWPSLAIAEESLSLPVEDSAIIDQHLFEDSKNACAPAAVANALRFGSPKMQNTWEQFVGSDDKTRMRFLIDRWFRSQPSIEFPTKKRLSFDGVLEEDLAAACRELSEEYELPPLRGDYLDRLAGEKSPAFLARVHDYLTDSLESGVPPILSLKTHVARPVERLNDEVAWTYSAHHWVVVSGVQKELRIGDLGFSLNLIEPNGGYQTTAFIYAENLLNFRALKGSEGNGEWLSGRPFLLVQAPGVLSLRPDEAEWKDRVIVTANYLIAPSVAAP